MTTLSGVRHGLHRAAPARLLLVLILCLVCCFGGALLPAQADEVDPGAPTVEVGPPVNRSSARAGRDFSDLPSGCRATDVPSVCRVTRFERRPFVVVWGDSHALMYLAPLTALARSHRVNLVMMYSGGCPVSKPFPASSKRPRLTCDRHNIGALAYVRQLDARRNVRLLVGSFWHGYRLRYALMRREATTGRPAGLTSYERHISELGAVRSEAMFKTLGKLRIRTDVLAQAATLPAGVAGCPEGDEPYQCDLPRSEALLDEADNSRWLARRTSLLAGSPRVLDPTRGYCDATTCYAHVRGANTYFDSLHLGEQMTRGLQRYLEPTFDAVLRQRTKR